MPRLHPETVGFLEQRLLAGYRFVAAPARAGEPPAMLQGAGAAPKNTILPCSIACRCGRGSGFWIRNKRARL